MMRLKTLLLSPIFQMDAEEHESERPKKPSTHDERGAADLERVTDYVEEKELSVGLDALTAVSGTAGDASAESKAQKEIQLLKVKVKPEDVEFICNELEVSKAVAERRLKENQGDVYKALVELIG
ncbi:Huntingtin-interacting protein HYPK [Paragonimus skrjabini miyazakii]|uniref:Huntingtin-interacting protein HYPK n=1 Tax=Paragonimus skrjabini miyazakii TaxID=59628 RepID=A0A8S9YV99_9TREM|nr:Huntingtin-interacting protein HYPK [Paragonimus skrjabini miyazakii]